jgi:Fur family transcriptional regulator, ferric uptake regulator
MSRREDVVRSLGRGQGFRTAQQLFAQMRGSGSRIGLATIYRTVQSMADEGEVDVLRTDAGEVAYRRCQSPEHHHHLVCRECGATVEIAARNVEQWAARVAADHDFDEVQHVLEVFGRCPACRAKAAAE